MKLFRKDATAGLRKAEDALAATEAKLTELASDRAVALAESDVAAPVIAIDKTIAEARVEAAIHRDRITALRSTVAEERDVERKAKYAAAIAAVEKEFADDVALGREIENLQREIGVKWNKLISRRQAPTSRWPEDAPLPSAAALQDLRDLRGLRREFSVAIWSSGQPAWNRPCSIPPPTGPIAVAGLQPAGLARYIENTGRAFIARLRMQQQPVSTPEDSEETAA